MFYVASFVFKFPPSPFSSSVCPGLIIHEGSSVYRIFKRWQAVNQQWKVLNYEKSKDLGDPVSSNSKTGARSSRGAAHRLASSSNGRPSQRLRTILNHHCGYTILHILSQLRPNDPRISAANREVVMRVTTVWVGLGSGCLLDLFQCKREDEFMDLYDTQRLCFVQLKEVRCSWSII